MMVRHPRRVCDMNMSVGNYAMDIFCTSFEKLNKGHRIQERRQRIVRYTLWLTGSREIAIARRWRRSNRKALPLFIADRRFLSAVEISGMQTLIENLKSRAPRAPQCPRAKAGLGNGGRSVRSRIERVRGQCGAKIPISPRGDREVRFVLTLFPANAFFAVKRMRQIPTIDIGQSAPLPPNRKFACESFSALVERSTARLRMQRVEVINPLWL